MRTFASFAGQMFLAKLFPKPLFEWPCLTVKFLKELPEGSEEEEGEKPVADNMSLLQTWQNAADYGSLLRARKRSESLVKARSLSERNVTTLMRI